MAGSHLVLKIDRVMRTVLGESHDATRANTLISLGRKWSSRRTCWWGRRTSKWPHRTRFAGWSQQGDCRAFAVGSPKEQGIVGQLVQARHRLALVPEAATGLYQLHGPGAPPRATTRTEAPPLEPASRLWILPSL